MEDELYEFWRGFLVKKKGGEVCAKRFLRVSSVSTAVQDLDEHSAARYIKAYINAFNLGFPIEFHTIIKPVDRLKLVKELEKIAVESSIVYEVNPLKTDSKVKAERARSMKHKILRDSLQPFETEVYVAASSCGESLDSVLEALKVKVRILRSTANSLGVELEEVNAEKILPKALLHGLTKKRDVMSRLFESLKRKLTVADFVTIPIFTLIPLLGRTRSSLRSSGVRLGVDIESLEEVYWNPAETASPHVLVIGPSGMGKSTFLSKISTSLSKAGLSVLIVDPKNEYERLLEPLGVSAVHLSLGKDLSLGILGLLKHVHDLIEKESFELVVDVLSSHPELGRREVFPCLRVILNNITPSDLKEGELETLDALRRLARFCPDEYSGYVVDKVLSMLSLISGKGVGLVDLLERKSGIYIVDVSAALVLDPLVMPLILKVLSTGVKLIMSSQSQGGLRYNKAIVIDEAWILLRDESMKVIEELIRIGRGFGTVVAIATQTVKDLTKNLGPLVDSFGLLTVLPSTSSDYWDEVCKLTKVSKERVERMRTLGRGYALVRMAPDPRTLLVRLD